MQLMADAMIDRHSRGSSFPFSCRRSMRSFLTGGGRSLGAVAGGDRMQFDHLKRREFITLVAGH
jgi:hypothetical protein